ncbi:ABC-2 type transport system ATP-binding protein [Actinacidiphila yanglinensis]|uniref:ABC-2 type transport system ATP-binding protein n=1 Tax=Actinacidiphila yanglinensis TaxID=310779 RepID=A0A1H5SS52_9ACTN|nr:ABC transporter ATP-binding protein [Actinacidiphila yanglinensis]SEF53416.1 ABC-2 type transport system ATP-binding protein [Actinacidiphila yanglinensis]
MSPAAAAAGQHLLASGPDRSPAIRVRGLRKVYGSTVAVEDLDLDVPHGTVHALLGPAGAGKATVLRILAARAEADGGDLCVGGRDPRTEAAAVRAAVGLAGRTTVVDAGRTCEENLLRGSALCRLPRSAGVARAAELLDRLGLSEVAAEPAGTLSSGRRRLLDLAGVLAGEPSCVLMDEPVDPLDAEGRGIVRDALRALAADGITVLLATRSPQEAGLIADRIGIMHRGRLVAAGTQDELLRLIPGGHIRLHFASVAELAAATARFGLDTAIRDDTALTLQIPGDGSVGLMRAVLDVLEDAAVEPRRLTVHSPGLEDVLASLVDDGARGPAVAAGSVPARDAATGREARGRGALWQAVLPPWLRARAPRPVSVAVR